jgi:hypothetical protein
MRVRLLATLGVVLVLVGAAVAIPALSWGPGPHIYDPNGEVGKQLAMARLGLIAGAISVSLGIASMTAGAVVWRRAHRGLPRKF